MLRMSVSDSKFIGDFLSNCCKEWDDCTQHLQFLPGEETLADTQAAGALRLNLCRLPVLSPTFFILFQ